MPRRASRVLPFAASLLLLSSVGACSGGAKSPRPTPSTSSSSATSSPSTTTSPAGPVPLVGGPVLAVKIDNTPAARPRIGLDKADVVYVEPVEGGLTRLLAVFSRSMPKEVGPVRSGRESDVELLANYGPVALAYSGSSSYTASILARGKQVNLSYDQDTRGFRRDHSRPAPYNVIGNTAELLARAKGSVKPHDIGFRYGAATPGGEPATSVTATWPSAKVSLAWNPARRQYLVTTDGRPDVSPSRTQYGATTVVVQYVQTRQSANRDVNGQPTPVIQLVGSGRASVLRDGKVWEAGWSRRSATGPTTFTSAGQVVTFAPSGTVWVLLVPVGRSATIR